MKRPILTAGESRLPVLLGAVVGALIVLAFYQLLPKKTIDDKKVRAVFRGTDDTIDAADFKTMMDNPTKYGLTAKDYILYYVEPPGPTPAPLPSPYGSATPSSDAPPKPDTNKTGGIHVTQQATFPNAKLLKKFIGDLNK